MHNERQQNNEVPLAFEGLRRNPLGCVIIIVVDVILWAACIGLIMLVVRLVKG